ncbi:hypothetical protein E4U40_005268 [Claviceps sp. LM458 group G5]|nr:hypothetical protein E4U40_005268 [Claviceps sp. LM458 group G5]
MPLIAAGQPPSEDPHRPTHPSHALHVIDPSHSDAPLPTLTNTACQPSRSGRYLPSSSSAGMSYSHIRLKNHKHHRCWISCEDGKNQMPSTGDMKKSCCGWWEPVTNFRSSRTLGSATGLCCIALLAVQPTEHVFA